MRELVLRMDLLDTKDLQLGDHLLRAVDEHDDVDPVVRIAKGALRFVGVQGKELPNLRLREQRVGIEGYGKMMMKKRCYKKTSV
jgi:hypothetical protein